MPASKYSLRPFYKPSIALVNPSFTEVKSTNHKIYHFDLFKVSHSVVFGIFTMLWVMSLKKWWNREFQEPIPSEKQLMRWQKLSESYFYKTLESSQKRITTRGRHGEGRSCCFMVRTHCGILKCLPPIPSTSDLWQPQGCRESNIWNYYYYYF